MKAVVTILSCLALSFAANAQAQRHPHPLRYGRQCLLRRGAIIASSPEAIRKLWGAFAAHDTNAVARLVSSHQIDSLIVDAIVYPVASPTDAYGVAEVRIPGFLRHVYTPWLSLDQEGPGVQPSR